MEEKEQLGVKMAAQRKLKHELGISEDQVSKPNAFGSRLATGIRSLPL
jgi:isopentenyldiphosphate isomerase